MSDMYEVIQMMAKALLALMLTSASLPVQEASGEVYYVAFTGDDSNRGSATEPWRTIARANQTLRAGDTVYIGEGVYNDYIRPVASGTADAPIIYTANPDNAEPVVIAGTPEQAKLVDLDQDYIEVRNLTIRWDHPPPDKLAWDWVRVLGAHCTLENLKIYRDGDPRELVEAGFRESGIGLLGEDTLIIGTEISGVRWGVTIRQTARRITIRDCSVHHTGGANFNILDSDGENRGLLVENCDIGPSIGGDNFQFHEGEPAETYSIANVGAIIRSNRLHGAGENAIDLKGAGNVVIDGNTIFACIGSNNGRLGEWNRWALQTISCGGDRIADHIIIRRNVMYDSCSGIEIQGNDYKIYNNTFVANNRDYTGSDSEAQSDAQPLFAATKQAKPRHGTAFKNNIVSNHNSAEVGFSLSKSRGNHDIDFNLYSSTSGARFAKTSADSFTIYTFERWQDVLDTFDTVAGKDDNSLDAPPGFVDVPPKPSGPPEEFDFRLRDGSPAIDSGGPLTWARGSGDGKQIELEDARYFSDGLGITDGDLIQVGHKGPVRIVSVDLDRNTITIDQSITWANGEAVSLPYLGEGPDIGAFEFDGR